MRKKASDCPWRSLRIVRYPTKESRNPLARRLAYHLPRKPIESESLKHRDPQTRTAPIWMAARLQNKASYFRPNRVTEQTRYPTFATDRAPTRPAPRVVVVSARGKEESRARPRHVIGFCAYQRVPRRSSLSEPIVDTATVSIFGAHSEEIGQFNRKAQERSTGRIGARGRSSRLLPP